MIVNVTKPELREDRTFSAETEVNQYTHVDKIYFSGKRSDPPVLIEPGDFDEDIRKILILNLDFIQEIEIIA